MYIKRVYQFLIIILAIIAIYALAKIIPILLPIFKLIVKVLTPFFVAGLLSYFLYPLINILDKKNIHKGLAITIIFSGFIIIFSIIGYFGFPIIIQQLYELSEQMPKLFKLYESTVYAMFENTSFLPEFFHDKMRMIMQQIEVGLESRIEHSIHRLINSIDSILVFAIVPVLVFYMLMDYKRLETYVYKLFSSIRFIPTDAVIRAIHTSLTKYIKGQLLISLFVALITFLIYYILGVHYYFLVFFIFIDYKCLETFVYKLFSSIRFIPTDAVIRAIHTSLTKYIKGQLLISLFVALITFLIYHTLGVHYALLLAILMGIMNIIPYFGPIIGSIPAVLLAFTTSWKLVIAVIISNVFVQMVESSFFSPYIMGKSVQIHPIGIIF